MKASCPSCIGRYMPAITVPCKQLSVFHVTLCRMCWACLTCVLTSAIQDSNIVYTYIHTLHKQVYFQLVVVFQVVFHA